jgi:uncharacterized membrane protein HdeD (DUF308 family)
VTNLLNEINMPAQNMHELKKHWLWTIIFGVFLALAGGFAVSSVLFSTIASVIAVGIAMILSGFAEVLHGFKMRTWGHFFWMLALGGFYIFSGAMVMRNPLLAASFLTLLLGASLIASGIIRTFIGIQIPTAGPKIFLLASSILTLLLGAIIIAQWPTSSLWVIGTFLGVDLFFVGMAWIGVGLALKTAA